MIKMTECKFCKCKPVCKHQEQWSKYCEEHISLRKESVLFDCEPVCKYYIEDKNLTNIEEQCDIKPWEEKRKEIFGDWFEKDKNKIFKAEDANIKPMTIKFDNGSEIKTIPHDSNVRSKRAEKQIKINIDNLTSIDDNDINNLINKIIRDGVLR